MVELRFLPRGCRSVARACVRASFFAMRLCQRARSMCYELWLSISKVSDKLLFHIVILRCSLLSQPLAACACERASKVSYPMSANSFIRWLLIGRVPSEAALALRTARVLHAQHD